jgi:hypothetical protein
VRNQMTFQLSNGPADDLIRLHAEHTDWDEPDVRYLRRKPNGKPKTLQLYAVGPCEAAFEFGNIEVTIRAIDDHIEIVLRTLPPRVALAA